MRPSIQSDGEEYYEYIVCYVDDVLGISCDAKGLMREIQRDFKFKKDKIEYKSMSVVHSFIRSFIHLFTHSHIHRSSAS